MEVIYQNMAVEMSVSSESILKKEGNDCLFCYLKEVGKQSDKIMKFREFLFKEFKEDTRSDLLIESSEFKSEIESESNSDLQIQEMDRNGLNISHVLIKTKEQAKRLNRNIGNYITIYSEKMRFNDGDFHQNAVNEAAFWLEYLLSNIKGLVLIAGLGNKSVSPDAIGPYAVSHVEATSHIEDAENVKICTIVPGVMGDTGLETAKILKSLVNMFKPSAMIVVDALATSNVERLGTTIQISDAGINPGSGINNNRLSINKESMGIPVISIGVPMVVEAASIISETIEAVESVLEYHGKEHHFLEELTKEDKIKLYRELLEPKARPLYVTVKDIVDIEKRLSYTISEAINKTFISINSKNDA